MIAPGTNAKSILRGWALDLVRPARLAFHLLVNSRHAATIPPHTCKKPIPFPQDHSRFPITQTRAAGWEGASGSAPRPTVARCASRWKCRTSTDRTPVPRRRIRPA